MGISTAAETELRLQILERLAREAMARTFGSIDEYDRWAKPLADEVDMAATKYETRSVPDAAERAQTLRTLWDGSLGVMRASVIRRTSPHGR